MKTFALISILSAVILFGCGSQSYEQAAKVEALNSAMPDTGAPTSSPPSRERKGVEDSGGPAQLAVLQNRMVIRTAQLAIRVDAVEKAEKQVAEIVRAHGGYVGNTSSSDLDSDHPRLSLTIRIPAGAFDTVMSKLEALGVRVSKVTNSEDVTEQVVDMDARLKTLLAQEETFRNMLRNTRGMEEVIRMQEKLTEVRGTIESIAAQRKSLATQAALSTITLTLEQSAIPHKPAKDPNWFAQAWAEATSEMAGVIRAGAVVGIWLLVFSPLWIPILIFAWRAIRSTMPRKAEV